jgi:acyl-coenzyme A thioesterase PaaI-like protein
MTAIQDRFKDNHCFGCGADNPLGMQIKSHWDGKVSICTYTPRPEQSAGPTHFLYGGTIASLIDCHSVGTAIANYYDLEGRELGSDPEIWCVTGRLTVNYLKPTPIDKPVELRAVVAECAEKKTILRCTLSSADEVTAEGEVVAIKVPYSWRE